MALAPVRIQLLGGLVVEIAGRPPVDRFPTRRSAELVALLALAPDGRLLRDQVIDALWPHLDAAAGAANLRKAAHHARHTLAVEDAVVLRNDRVELLPGRDVSTDVAELLEAAAAAIDARDPEAARAVASGATGELLPEARYEDWASDARRLVRARVLALLRLAGEWERLLELDPLDEDAARRVMEIAVEEGRRHRAIEVYGQLRRALAVDVGVAPSPSTEALYATVVASFPGAGSDAVDRPEELARARAALGGRVPRMVVVRGPAGIGSSTFLRELSNQLRSGGQVVAAAVGTEPEDSFGVLAALVDDLVLQVPGAVDVLGPRARDAIDRVHAVAHGLEPPVVAGGPAQGCDASPEAPLTRHQLLGVVRRLLAAIDTPVVLIVDDAHRADESSLGVLGLLTGPDRGSCSVVVCHRTEVVHRPLQRAVTAAARRAPLETIELPPFDLAQLRELAASMGRPTDEPSIERLAVRSDGNPLLAAELCRAGPAADVSLPVEVVGRWLSDLDDEEADQLGRLALLSEPLDLATVAALTGPFDGSRTDAAEVSPAISLLDAALGAGVLVVDQGRYRFRHELVRTALADQLAPHDRQEVHRTAAERLAADRARPALVARHFLLGGCPDEAVPWLLRAADEVVGLGGHPAAVEHLDRVLEHQPDHAEALRRRAAALDAMGDLRAVAAYDAAVRVATPDEVHELRPLQALAMVKLGDPEGGMRVVEGAMPRRLESQLARALAYCGAGLMGHADPAIGCELAAEGRRLALRSGDPAALVVASWAQAGAAHARGELRSSLVADLTDTSSFPELAVSVFDGQLCITQRLLYGARPYDDVIGWAAGFRAEAERLGAARATAFATTLGGEAELLSGRLDAAEDDLRLGHRLHHEMGAATGEAFALQRLAELAGLRGDVGAADHLLDEALAVARDSDVGFHLFDRIYGARISLARDPQAARDVVDEAEELVCGPLETCPGCRITLVVPAALALARAGELDRLVAYEESCRWLADVVMRLPAWYAALDEVRGQRCLAEGAGAEAERHLQQAVEGFRTAGQPYDIARVEGVLHRLEA
jgi:DNA-binding SARP family transcriptional activator/tetratricopeptide (TPR) repeat protein